MSCTTCRGRGLATADQTEVVSWLPGHRGCLSTWKIPRDWGFLCHTT